MALPSEVNFRFFLAPMVGLSHVSMRSLVARYLPKDHTTIWPTEMLSSYKLPLEDVGKTVETFRNSTDTFIMPQLLANDEENIRLSIRKLEDWGANGIDINMGCPVRKALKHNYGVALMGDPSYASQVVAMARRHTKRYISVKIRSGLQKDSNFLLKFSEGLKDAGADWICLHPRMANEKRRGKSDWSQIKILKEQLNLDVIGNGDIQIASDALDMLELTDCSGVMIGRALTARPWMVWQIGKKLGLPNPAEFSGDPPQTPEEEAQWYGEALLYLLSSLAENFNEEELRKRFLFYVVVSHPWLNFGHSLYQKISAAKSYEETFEVVENFFKSSGLRFSARTDLRY